MRRCMNEGRGWVVAVLAVGVFLSVTAGTAQADSKTLAKDAEKSVRASQSAMFKGDMAAAQEELNKASGLLEQLKQEDPQNTKIRSLETQINRLKTQMESRLRKGAPAKPEATTVEPAKGASGKLPAGVSFRLKEADRLLGNGERVASQEGGTVSAEYRIEAARGAAKSAREKMAEIEQKFAGQYPADHPDIKAMNDRIAALEVKANEMASGVRQERESKERAAAQSSAASGPWVTRLKPYVTGLGQPGHNPEKYLIASATQEKDEMAKRLAIHSEASAAMAEYKAANVTNPTPELGEVAQELEHALTEFAKSCASYLDSDLASAEQKIKDAESFIAGQEAKAAAKEPVIPISKDQLVEIQGILNRAAGLAKQDDPRLAAHRAKLEELGQRDAKLRAARVADTRMTADKYKGSDADEIKQKAGESLKKAHADAQILRTTIISPDWKEESVIEYTDTTQTALRHRVTRSMTVQIAGKKGADTFLYTLYVGKDRRADGTWGELQGHVMFTDPMLEENVSKDAQ